MSVACLPLPHTPYTCSLNSYFMFKAKTTISKAYLQNLKKINKNKRQASKAHLLLSENYHKIKCPKIPSKSKPNELEIM